MGWVGSRRKQRAEYRKQNTKNSRTGDDTNHTKPVAVVQEGVIGELTLIVAALWVYSAVYAGRKFKELSSDKS